MPRRKRAYKKVCKLLKVAQLELPKPFPLGEGLLKKLENVHNAYQRAKPESTYSKTSLTRLKLLKTLVEINEKRVLRARKYPNQRITFLNYTEEKTKEVLYHDMEKILRQIKTTTLSQHYNTLRIDYLKARHAYISGLKLEKDSKKLLDILPEMVEIPSIKKLKKVSDKHTKVQDLHKDFEGGEEVGELQTIRDYYAKELSKIKTVDSESMEFTRGLLGIKSSKLNQRISELKKESRKRAETWGERRDKELLNKINFFANSIERFLERKDLD